MPDSCHILGLELLQVALGRRSSLSHVPTDKEWDSIYDFADKHTIHGILWAGIEKLPKEQVPYMDLLMEWTGQVYYIKSVKDTFDKVLSEFSDILVGADIPYVVFKGPAVASHYPNPSLRTMGDIDFYVPSADFSRCVEVIEKELSVEIDKCDVDKHYSFDWKDIRFEMHYQMETFGCKKYQQYFGKLVDQYISLGCSSFAACGKDIPMLQPMAGLLIVFKHWMTHFLGEGVGLRQTTDLAVLIDSYQNKIDVASLKEHLKGIGYMNAFDAMVALMNRYYNVQWKGYGSLTRSDYRYADKMMSDILKNGNFGRSDYKFKEGVRKRLETAARFFSHCFKYFCLAPMDILCLIPTRIIISIKAH